jgi:O-antigen/teichoic acid export membrane protein
MSEADPHSERDDGELRRRVGPPDDPIRRPSSIAGLKRHGVVNLASKIAGQVLAYVSVVLVARSMGNEDFGWVSILLAWFGLAGMLATGGLEFVLLRFLRIFLDDGRVGEARALSSLATRFSLGAGLLAAVVLEVILVMTGLLAPQWLALLLLLPVVPASAYLSIRRNEMLALERSFLAQLSVSFVRPVSTILLLGLVTISFGAASPLVLGALAIAGGFVLAAVIAGLTSRRVLGFVQEHPRGTTSAREWFSIGAAMIVVTFSFLAMNQVDTIMVGAMRPQEEAGFYDAAFRLASILTLPTIALQSVVASRISQAHVAGATETLKQLSSWVANWGLLLTCGMALALLATSDLLLGLYGPGFLAATTPLWLMLGGAVVTSALGPTSYLLHLTGRQRTLAIVTTMGFVFNLVGNYVLVERFGMIGAAASTATALVLMKSALVIVVRARLGFWPLASIGIGRWWIERGSSGRVP